jgi:2-amino-4-hydroxy-6-hydroxymethyldihydropteridine diphosphokinase
VIREVRKQLELPAVLALGSNLGDREGTIRAAVADIGAIPRVKVVKASGLVESAAVKPDGVDDSAPAYLNAVIAIRTSLSPEDLLEAIARVEQHHGRIREERWGDRTLDIDIVAMGGLRRSTETLTIPHPRAASRAFVLEPWLEIEPNAALPGTGRVDELLAATHDVVTRMEAEPLL